jgi:ABC-type branched-subunit amino acid transport system ATPase component
LNQSVAQTAVEPTSSPEKVLDARGLHKRFGGTDVLRGVDLSLRRGEVVLLRGPNGAGKTTLINTLTGHLEADAGEITIRTNGTVERFSFPFGTLKRLNPFLHFLPERVAREGVMRTWQDTRLFSSLGLAENIAVAAPAHPGQNPLNLFFRPGRVRRFEQTAANEARHRLNLLQLDGRDSSSGNRISLGQTKRVAIAQAISARARILFFDEPLAGLDADGIKSVVDMLRELSQDHGVSIVIVEHQMNAPHILQIADTIWTLDQGVLTSRPIDDIATDSDPAGADIFEAFLVREGWQVAREQDLPRGAHLRVYRKKVLAKNSAPRLEIQGLAIKRGNRWVIGRENDSQEVLGTLHFKLYPGDLGLLLAPNGWGKTTVLDALTGLACTVSGSITLNGRDCAEMPSWQRATMGIKYFRASKVVFPTLSRKETAQLFRLNKSGNAMTGRNRLMNSLSGGEQRHHLTQILAHHNYSLLVLDEPFSGLDDMAFRELATKLSENSFSAKATLMALPA